MSDYERSLIPLDSEAGQSYAARLSDGHAARLAQLLDAFEPQAYGSWCGLAAAACALQVLGATASATTQAALFKEALIVTRSTTGQLTAGLSLADLEALIIRSLRERRLETVASVRCASAADPAMLASTLDADLAEEGASTYSANYDSSDHAARSAVDCDLAADLPPPPPILLVNVLRTVQGSTTGHWMLAAGSVRVGGERWVLVLDPAAHKLGPHWLPELVLISCMATLNSRGEPRGYLAIDFFASRGTDRQGAGSRISAPERVGDELEPGEEEFTLI